MLLVLQWLQGFRNVLDVDLPSNDISCDSKAFCKVCGSVDAVAKACKQNTRYAGSQLSSVHPLTGAEHNLKNGIQESGHTGSCTARTSARVMKVAGAKPESCVLLLLPLLVLPCMCCMHRCKSFTYDMSASCGYLKASGDIKALSSRMGWAAYVPNQ